MLYQILVKLILKYYNKHLLILDKVHYYREVIYKEEEIMVTILILQSITNCLNNLSIHNK